MRASALLTIAAAALALPAISLAQGGTTQASQGSEKSDPNRLICRRIQESGSMARRTRQCYTRAQWDQLAEQQRSNSPGMTSMTGGTSGN